MEQNEFPCECGAMVSIVSGESGGSSGSLRTSYVAQCLDCGRQFKPLEIELILRQHRALMQRAAAGDSNSDFIQ